MTKTEKAIIDSVKAKYKEFNNECLPKLTIMSCIKEYTTHSAETVLKLMYEQRLIRYDKETYQYRLARGLLDDYVARDEKEGKELSIYVDYHADEILEKVTRVIAYQDRLEIADFFNKDYIDVDLVKNVRRSSKDLFPEIKPEDIELQHIRVWLYKLYLTCYKLSSAYKQLPQAYKEAAATMTDKSVKKDGYYVIFDVITSTYIAKKYMRDYELQFQHTRHFDTLKKAEEFIETLKSHWDNHKQYDNGDCFYLDYTNFDIVQADKIDSVKVAISCSHLLPF